MIELILIGGLWLILGTAWALLKNYARLVEWLVRRRGGSDRQSRRAARERGALRGRPRDDRAV